MFELATTMPLAIAYAVIGVGDMQEALDLWVGRFGMEVVVRQSGDDPELARAWNLPVDGIVDQALLRTPGVKDGGIHLVKFRDPGPAVRDGASPTALLPKSIDVAVRDIEARYAELKDAGYQFRSKVGAFETEQRQKVFEVHMTGHDGINVVLVEQPGQLEPASSRGYGVAPLIVAISPDNRLEAEFLQHVLGLEELMHNRFGGPSVERTIGLPPGASLDVRILGARSRVFGRIELVQYEGVASENRYPRAVAPARGQLSVTYFVDDLARIVSRAAGHVSDLGRVASIYGRARMATLTTPAGLRIHLVESP